MSDVLHDIFLNLSTFTEITRLELSQVSFPTVATFGRVVCAFPALQQLVCRGLQFSTHHFLPHAFPKRASAVRLSTVSLDGDSFDDITNFMATTGIDANLATVHIGTSLFQGQPLGAEVVVSGNLQRLVRTAGVSLRNLELGLVLTGECDISLVRISQLERLNLYFVIDALDVVNDVHYLSRMFSCLTTNVLKRVFIYLDIRSLPLGGVDELKTVLTGLSLNCCSSLDRILALPLFPRLEHVRIEVMDSSGLQVVAQEFWHKVLKSHIPILHRRGILYNKPYYIMPLDTGHYVRRTFWSHWLPIAYSFRQTIDNVSKPSILRARRVAPPSDS